jgi:hypothetical protein
MFLGDNNIQIAIDTSFNSNLLWEKCLHVFRFIQINNLCVLLSMCQGAQNEVSIKFHHLNFLHQEVNQFTYNVLKWTPYTYRALDLMPIIPVQMRNNYFCFIVGINKNTHETIQWHHRLAHLNIFSMKEIQNKKFAIMPIILDFMEVPFFEGYGQMFQGFLLSNETL